MEWEVVCNIFFFFLFFKHKVKISSFAFLKIWMFNSLHFSSNWDISSGMFFFCWSLKMWALPGKEKYLSIYLSIYLYIYLSIDRKIDWFLGIIHFKPRIYLKQLSHSFHLVNLELKNLSGLEIIEILEKSVKISKINNCILVANLQSSIFVVLSNHFHDIFII